MKKDLIIIAVGSKFKVFDYYRFEVEQLKKYSDVIIFDVSHLAAPSYSENLSSEFYEGDLLIRIDSYASLIDFLVKLRAWSRRRRIVIMDFLVPDSIASLLSELFFRTKRIKTVTYGNSGVPIHNVRNKITYRSIIKSSARVIVRILYKLFNIKHDYLLYAGKYFEDKVVSDSSGYLVNCIPASSWDYSNFVLRAANKNISGNIGSAGSCVLLDGAGPMFASDASYTGGMDCLTHDVWYPRLDHFLTLVEKKYDCSVVISAHPKSNHQRNPEYFGFRKVAKNQSHDLVKSSSLVITRGSTSISYAVLYRKPIVLIYSNQMLRDRSAMKNTMTMASELDSLCVNIDDPDVMSQLSVSVKINEDKYQAYIYKYLTSSSRPLTNSEILLSKIIGVNE